MLLLQINDPKQTTQRRWFARRLCQMALHDHAHLGWESTRNMAIGSTPLGRRTRSRLHQRVDPYDSRDQRAAVQEFACSRQQFQVGNRQEGSRGCTQTQMNVLTILINKTIESKSITSGHNFCRFITKQTGWFSLLAPTPLIIIDFLLWTFLNWSKSISLLSKIKIYYEQSKHDKSRLGFMRNEIAYVQSRQEKTFIFWQKLSSLNWWD